MVIENNKKKEKIKILKKYKIYKEREVAWVFETKSPTRTTGFIRFGWVSLTWVIPRSLAFGRRQQLIYCMKMFHRIKYIISFSFRATWKSISSLLSKQSKLKSIVSKWGLQVSRLYIFTDSLSCNRAVIST